MPLPVAGRRQRIDGEHLITGCGQGAHPSAAVSFDTDLHPPSSLGRIQLPPLRRNEPRDQRMQASHAIQALGQPRHSRPFPLVIHDLNIVMFF